MIFATCGSSHFRFDRMMEALAALQSEELYVQHGPAEPPECVCADPFLPFATIVKKIEMADVVISHAGVGSILCAIRAGHTPVIFPRLKRYHEAVDDHQSELAEALAERGTAIVAWTASDLPAAVASAPPRRGRETVRRDPLVDAVRATIMSKRIPEPAAPRPPLAGSTR